MNNPFFNKYFDVKSKNVGPFLAFGEMWFEKYQSWLIMLLNLPILRVWFRWILRIHKDCRYNDIIVEIQPNNYKVLLRDGQIKGDFRTHPKFSKRIYFAFRWWWWILHYLDEVFKPFPIVQFGFDTLTAYPTAGANEPIDGEVSRLSVNESFSSIMTGNGTNYDNNLVREYALLQASTTTNQYANCRRYITTFNTSSIGAGSSISNALESFMCNSLTNGLGSCALHKSSSSPASNSTLAASDYGSTGTTTFGNIAYASVVTGTTTYNDITLNASGISNIAKTGITKTSYILDWDVNRVFSGSWVSGAQTMFRIYTADQTGTSSDPKLVITYSTSSIKKVCGVDYANIKSASGVAKASIKKIIGVV